VVFPFFHLLAFLEVSQALIPVKYLIDSVAQFFNPYVPARQATQEAAETLLDSFSVVIAVSFLLSCLFLSHQFVVSA